MYIHIHIYIYTHTYIHIHREREREIEREREGEREREVTVCELRRPPHKTTRGPTEESTACDATERVKEGQRCVHSKRKGDVRERAGKVRDHDTDTHTHTPVTHT